jgi:hypothetical protein
LSYPEFAQLFPATRPVNKVLMNYCFWFAGVCWLCTAGFSGVLSAEEAPAWVDKARVNASAGNFHIAAYDLEQALLQSPDDVNLQRACARQMDKTGNPALARRHWLRVAELAYGDSEAASALQSTALPVSMAAGTASAAQSLEPGLGLWIGGGGREQVAKINTYNSKAALGQRVRYLFVKAGQWVLDRDLSGWDLDLDFALVASAEQAGDADVYLWLDGSSQGAESVRPEVWERMAADLAATVQTRHFGGVLLSPRCCSRSLFPLMAALRRHLNRPLAVEVNGDESAIFGQADFVVLRPVPTVGNLNDYLGTIRDLASGVLRSAQTVKGRVLIGLSGVGPAPAERWFSQGRLALGLAIPLSGDNPLLGVSVWGMAADSDGVVLELAPQIWEQMQLPINQMAPEAWHQMQDGEVRP